MDIRAAEISDIIRKQIEKSGLVAGRDFNLAFSPDSRLLVIMRSDCTICLMDTATGEVVRTIDDAIDGSPAHGRASGF